MKIAILTYGTRGDVQPYAVLGHALARRGHAVRIAVCENLVDMTRSIGLDTVAVPVDSQEFMSSEQGRAVLSAGKTTKFIKELSRRETEASREIGDALVEASRDAEVVIASVLAVARATSLVEASGQRMLAVYVPPIHPTAQFASPYIFRSTHAPTALLRRASHLVFETVFWWGSRRNVRAFRRQLGLPARVANPLRALRRAQVPVSHLITRALLPEPPDWPDHVRNVGEIAVPRELREAWGEATVPPDLERWLAAGDAPVYFGFGSMPVLDAVAARAMIETVAQRLGVRALIGAGWSDVAAGSSEAVYVVNAFDHDQVLPRCVAAVHHGGAGTTQAVMRAGLPAVVAHVFADQPLWGRRIADQGLGAQTRYQHLSADRLVELLRPLLDPAAKRSAEAAAAVMATEDAIGTIVDMIEDGHPN